MDVLEILEQGSIALGYCLAALGALKIIARKTKTEVDDKVLDAIGRPLSAAAALMSVFRKKEDK